jgi:hypothetical protein
LEKGELKTGNWLHNEEEFVFFLKKKKRDRYKTKRGKHESYSSLCSFFQLHLICADAKASDGEKSSGSFESSASHSRFAPAQCKSERPNIQHKRALYLIPNTWTSSSFFASSSSFKEPDNDSTCSIEGRKAEE